MTKRKKILLGIIATAIIAYLGWHFYSKKMAGGWGQGFPPMPVSVTTVKEQPWQEQIQATGTLNANEGVMLKSEAAGRITKLFVTSGATVKAGDPLLEINPAILQAELSAAVAHDELSKGDYQRAIALYKRGALSKHDLEAAKANELADAAAVAQYKAQLDQNIIRAPFAGKLGIIQVNLGDFISMGQALVNLQSLDPLRVDFSVPENYFNKVQIGDKVQLKADMYLDKIFNGAVQAIDSAIDSNTRNLALRAQIPNPEHKLIPGSFVQVTLLTGKPQPYLTIPLTAIVYDATQNFVYTVVKEHAVKTPIVIDQQNSEQASIKSGLKAGDVVVTAGQLKIGDGAPVMLLPSH